FLRNRGTARPELAAASLPLSPAGCFIASGRPVMCSRSLRSGCLLLVLLASGRAAHAGEKPAQAPEVPLARPVVREVTDYEDFPGRAEARERVELRARVAGYLNAMRFKEGAAVRKGDILFEIDARPYQAQLNQALAQVELHKATLQLA